MGSAIEQRRVATATIEHAVLETGPSGGPLALLLHGFPDTAWTWRHLLPALAESGYHAVAPFLRGYHPTGVPADGRYQCGALVADAVALHEALGGDERAVLVGHDWGALVAYATASYDPPRWHKVVASAVPPLASLVGGLLTYEQLKRSWYIFFFQSPLADAVVAADGLAFLGGLWADWSPGYDAGYDLGQLRAALPEAANVTAALGYYRSLFDASSHSEELAAQQAAALLPVPQPTLYVHGADDACLGAELITDALLAMLGPGSAISVVERAGHFSHLERPAEVNARVREFLAG